MVTLALAEEEFRTHIRDNVEPYFCSQPRFIKFYNEAIKEACLRRGLIFDRTTASVCEVAVAASDQLIVTSPLWIAITRVQLDSGSIIVPLDIYDIEGLDYVDQSWRDVSSRPSKCYVGDANIQLDSPADLDYTMRLEGYRLPLTSLSDPAHEPEIAEIHHDYLLDWVYHRYYDTRDSDVYTPALAQKHKQDFADYFGERRTANRLRGDQAARTVFDIFV